MFLRSKTSKFAYYICGKAKIASILLALLLTGAVVFSAQIPTLAASAKDDAIAAFKAKKYSDAASKLETFLKANANDAAAHHYLAMSYQELKNTDKAKQHFEWIKKNSKDPAMLSAANKGLQSLAAKPTSDAKSTGTGKEKQTSLPTIYDFGAVWCVPCKKFAPVFDKVAESYKGKVDFQHIDAEEEKQKALVDKYKVMTLPTIVFVDKAGRTVATVNKVMTEAELTKQTDALIK